MQDLRPSKYTDLYLREIFFLFLPFPAPSLLPQPFTPPPSPLSISLLSLSLSHHLPTYWSIFADSLVVTSTLPAFPLHHIPHHTHTGTHTHTHTHTHRDILCGSVIPINSGFLCCLADHCFKINLKDRKKHTKSSFNFAEVFLTFIFKYLGLQSFSVHAV